MPGAWTAAFQFLVPIFLYAIAVDAFWGGIFAGRPSAVLGVVVAGVSLFWTVASFIPKQERKEMRRLMTTHRWILVLMFVVGLVIVAAGLVFSLWVSG